MRAVTSAILGTCLSVTCCARQTDQRPALAPGQVAAVADSVRVFMGQVASGVSREGPAAWRRYFADTASFFMAAEGQLVFSNYAAASTGIQGLTHLIRSIELIWGDSVRVDALAAGLAVVGAPYREVRVDSAGHHVDESGYFTGLVEHRAPGWQFRDAHWSVLEPPSAVR